MFKIILKKIFLIIAFLLVGFMIGALLYFKQAVCVPLSDKESYKLFLVEKNTPRLQIAKELKNQKLIKSPLAFILYTKIKKLNLSAGQYELSPSMNVATIANIIGHGKVAKVKITFPEGFSISQIADRLSARGIVDKDKFEKEAEDEEGYLFPDTYTFSTSSTTKDIINIMKNNFQKRTAGLGPTRDQLILASIIEREASSKDDRSKIASVYANRLNDGLRLEADPTVQYAKGSWDQITQADYRSVYSPYNTYLHAGLPPGPICNPGLASIKAAINPVDTDYYYFFHTKDGRTIYSKDYSEHQASLLKYRSGKL